MVLDERDFCNFDDISKMSDANKEIEIKRLERARDKLGREIEALLREYSSTVKYKKLKPRRRDLGDSPNDYYYNGVKFW